MLKFENKLSLEDIQSSLNLNEKLSEEDSSTLGEWVYQGYSEDRASRKEWESRYENAIKLAQQMVEEKSTPWQNASNVKFPLVTIAALQFAARAYPALVKAPDLVKFRVQGEDPQGLKAARAQRISTHMSYQLLEEDEPWEEEQDRAFIALPILGCVFKKSYYKPTIGNCSRTVLPMNLVVNYFTTSLEQSERKTEILPKLSRRKYREMVLSKVYSEHDFTGGNSDGDQSTAKTADERQGVLEPIGEKPLQPLEQHCYLDLDGDGYEEPYVVTIDRDTRKVLRIVQRFKEIVSEQSLKAKEIDTRLLELAKSVQQVEQPSQEDVEQLRRVEETIHQLQAARDALLAEPPKVLRIEPMECYTKYSFIPSADGGFYDIGFGALLGPLNGSVDTLINQLIDAGTLNNGSQGFLGKGARMKGGKLRFSPFEWKRVDVAGATLRDSFVPLPVNAPSPVLFQLLGLLINYTERVSSVTETTSGENPGQNTPAYNMASMLEQGLQVFNAIFKRTYRSFRKELRKLYKLNGMYLNPVEYFEYHDAGHQVSLEDYKADPKDLIPAADPNAFSSHEKQQKAVMLAERAAQVPGYDAIKIEQRLLEALDVPNAAELFPLQEDENGQPTLVHQPPPNPEIELKKMEEARRTAEGETKLNIAWQEAAANIALKEAQVIETYARAEKTAEAIDLDKLRLLLDELKAQREYALQKAQMETKSEDTAGADQ